MNKTDIDKWQQERAEKMSALADQLEEGVSRFQNSDEYRTYLKVAAQFHNYSWGNVLLICLQRPEARRIAGYRTWQKVGRQVKAGEKGIKILAPLPFKVQNEETGEAMTIVARFKPVTVFDIEQTEGAPLPELVAPSLDGECATGVYEALSVFAGELGIRLKNDDPAAMPAGAMGYYSRQRSEIYVAPAGPLQMTHVLAHELGHALDIELKQSPRAVRETVAESVAYIVASYFGLPGGDYSFFYIGSWLGDADGRKTLKLVLDRSQRIADKLISSIDQHAMQEEELEEAA